MSKTVSTTKRLPLCLSLGITEVLSDQKIFGSDFLDQFSYQDKTTFLTDTENFVLVCGNKQKANDYEPNPFLVSFGVRRAVAMKSHTNLPVIIVVNNYFETKMIIKQFNRLSSCFKLYASNKTQREGINEEIRGEYPNEADFIITTYDTFWEITTSKSDPSSEQIVLINPLRRRNIIKDVSKLDVIFGCIHRHKRIRPNYSFILDEAQFPILTKKDYQYYFNASNSLFFQCKERNNHAYDNPFSEAIPHLTKDQYQLFIFRELFRGRKLIKELVKEFKLTFTYKLYLFSNGLFPSSEGEFSSEMLARKEKLDQKVLAGIVKQMHLFTKGRNTKTITGKVAYNNFDITGDLNKQELTRSYSWDEPKETTRFLPLIFKYEGRFHLSTLGEAIFAVSSSFGGVEINFSDLLAHFSRILYKNENYKFSIKEIIIFYLQLIGCNYETVKGFEEIIPEDLKSEKKNDEMIEIIEKKFNPIIKNYKRNSAKKVLGAFEKLMNTEAYIFYQQFKNYGKEEKRSWKEKRGDAILRRANYQPLTVKFTGDYYHMFWQGAKKVLEELVEEGLLVCINTNNSRGKSKLKYLTQELLDANPHLQKNCGNCQWYNKRFKTCTFLRLQQAKDPSTMDSGDLKYSNGTIIFEATACGKFRDKADYQTKGDKVRYTTTVDELTQNMKKIPIGFIAGNVSEYEYHCFSCREQIEEFGTSDKIFFPRRRVICPNCSTVYLQLKDKKKVRVKTEQRHLLRGLYYKETGSIPEILKKNDPSGVYVIHDIESARLKINEASDEPPFHLVIGKHEIALDKMKFIYFSGRRHQELEQTLRLLADLEPEKFNYEIKRTEQKSNKKRAESDSSYKKPFSSEDYFYLKKIIKKSSDDELFNHQFLESRHLSNIGGMLSLKIEIEMESFTDWSYDHQLLVMIDLLMKVNGGEVKSSFYGTQLEAQSNRYFFDLLKAEAMQVDLWTKGRVNSRLVKDILLSFSKNASSAFSPLDALLNQMLRSFRAEVDKMFHKMGMDPALLGPGFFHRRKTKSDIDKLGFYFDLIEAVRVLVLVTMVKAIREGTLGFKDCQFVLGENGQEIYQVKGSSLDKFTNLVSEALEHSVFHRGEIVTFQLAFEFNFLCLRVALENCLAEIKEHKQISSAKIKKCFDYSLFSPFAFCPAEIEKKLLALNRFASKEGVIFEGIEQEVLERKSKRESYLEEAMNHWLNKEVIEKSNAFRLTKHQNKEQDRSLLVVLLMLYLAYEQDSFLEKYSTHRLRELLGLTQNQIKRILDKMVSRELLIREKTNRENLFQLNLENQNVKDFRFVLGVALTPDEAFQRELIISAQPHLEKVSKTISSLNIIFDDQQKNICSNFWLNWEPTNIIRRVINWVDEQVTTSKEFFKMIGEIHGQK